jgi:dihydroorotate dehydrogenase electron transfer subunit
MNPLHAKHYADHAIYTDAEILANEQIAESTYRLRCNAPEIAAAIVPGQFVMLRITGLNDPLIGRALALYDIVRSGAGDPVAIEVVYLVKGKLTQRLTQLQPGQRVSLWGPLGNGFSDAPCDHLIMTAGGVGITPFLAVSKEALGLAAYGENRRAGYAQRATLLYGVRSAKYVASEHEFLAAGVSVQISTDDGTRGSPVRVPDLLREFLAQADPNSEQRRLLTCGPEIMMQRVAEEADRQAMRCEVSLETPMACGIGVCFSCVAKIKQSDGTWDYKRTCVEGPVFSADQIHW